MEEALGGSLLEALDSQQLNCLNEGAPYTLKSILQDKKLNSSSNYLLSDADEQLILNVPFNQVVRIRALIIKSAGEPEQRPRRIKLFINRPTLGFEDATDAREPEAAQIIELTDEQVAEGKRIPLRFVRFQSVNSLHIFVETNGGDDATRIDAVDVIGVQAQGTRDLSGLKVVED
ncbi:uncharacterized protein PHACADRAFT_195847 [Phanerochaete carnosa HHB-10118-sp]|uniref:PITH domain-containing protein n=1 Tax=Phanerochaete carnosa (strain HHB-10118-sp) TaxID=650164 RepID=K5VW87_PHACS|nr:uncharacterized protein PHACADRAFT_195847 [Phanerochaete carnosa HHB-10118-sp]EKM55798.1 hypothetical protein PHACADRAFT_195847 [Phanerochaete carnosa HHB-10118-sp]